jgi:hypothetical protein
VIKAKDTAGPGRLAIETPRTRISVAA